MADANGNQTNSLDYAYHNAGPGSVAQGSRAVDSATETTMQNLNPGIVGATPQSGQAITDVQDAQVGPSDASNPVAAENARNFG